VKDGRRKTEEGKYDASGFRLPSSVFRLPSSLFPLPSSVFRLPSSVFQRLRTCVVIPVVVADLRLEITRFVARVAGRLMVAIVLRALVFFGRGPHAVLL